MDTSDVDFLRVDSPGLFNKAFPVLARALYKPGTDQQRRWQERYLSSDRQLWAAACGEELIGVVGWRPSGAGCVEVTHIAVARHFAGQGVGRVLIEWVRNHNPGCALAAETDGDAMGFYRALGFQCDELPERYAGVVRYRCEWHPGIYGPAINREWPPP
jgi:GNAT superfamily N-acetyltransferase